MIITDSLLIFPEPRRQPCTPSPCGANSVCKVVNDHAVCTCQAGFIGNPPACRPECVVSADCPLTQACLANKCQDPCPGTCGQNTRCQVVNHNPICSCHEGFTGDPFTRCFLMPSKYNLTFVEQLYCLLKMKSQQILTCLQSGRLCPSTPANHHRADPTPSVK